MVQTLLVARGVMFVAGSVLIGLGIWVNTRRRGPVLLPFVVLVVAVGTLAILDSLAAGGPTTLSLVWVTAFITIPCAFTWFVIEYYGLTYLASIPSYPAPCIRCRKKPGEI